MFRKKLTEKSIVMKSRDLKKTEVFDAYTEELCEWNDSNVAFIKNDIFEGRQMWMIYAADGTRIAATDDRDFAFIMAKQNDLEPQSVH